MKKVIFGNVILFLFLPMLYYFYLNHEYSISEDPADIERAIATRLPSGGHIRMSEITDNKLHFLFTAGDAVGDGELFKGLNGKYKFHFLGQGTNQIRDRVIETNKGQYLKLSGRNDRNIGKIIINSRRDLD